MASIGPAPGSTSFTNKTTDLLHTSWFQRTRYIPQEFYLLLFDIVHARNGSKNKVQREVELIVLGPTEV